MFHVSSKHAPAALDWPERPLQQRALVFGHACGLDRQAPGALWAMRAQEILWRPGGRKQSYDVAQGLRGDCVQNGVGAEIICIPGRIPFFRSLFTDLRVSSLPSSIFSSFVSVPFGTSSLFSTSPVDGSVPLRGLLHSCIQDTPFPQFRKRYLQIQVHSP